MKTLLTLILALPLLSGCTFLKNNQPALLFLARESAEIGTKLDLQSHPDHRPYFMASEQALTRLVDSGNSDPAAFAAALASLPVSELTGPNGSIYISTFIVLWDVVRESATSIDKEGTAKAYILAVRDGMRGGLIL